MLETLDYTIRIGSIPTFLYLDLYLYSAYAAHFVYYFETRNGFQSTGIQFFLYSGSKITTEMKFSVISNIKNNSTSIFQAGSGGNLIIRYMNIDNLIFFSGIILVSEMPITINLI